MYLENFPFFSFRDLLWAYILFSSLCMDFGLQIIYIFTHTQVTVCPVAHINMVKRGEQLKKRPNTTVFEGKIE